MGAQGPIMTADPGRRIRLRLGLGFLSVGFLGLYVYIERFTVHG